MTSEMNPANAFPGPDLATAELIRARLVETHRITCRNLSFDSFCELVHAVSDALPHRIKPGQDFLSLSFTSDLKLNSLELVTLVMEIEEACKTSIPDVDAERMHCALDLVRFLDRQAGQAIQPPLASSQERKQAVLDAKVSHALPSETLSENFHVASELFMHYSTIRATLVGLLLPLSFGLAGWAVSSRTDHMLLTVLLIAEAIIYAASTMASLYFSARQSFIRAALIDMEAGRDHGIFHYIERLKLTNMVDHISWDVFNMFLTMGGIVVHLSLYLYLAFGPLKPGS